MHLYYIWSRSRQKDTPRGDEAKNWQSKDWAWAKSIVWFEEIEVNPADVHDSQRIWPTKMKFGTLKKDISKQMQKYYAAMKKPRGTSPKL